MMKYVIKGNNHIIMFYMERFVRHFFFDKKTLYCSLRHCSDGKGDFIFADLNNILKRLITGKRPRKS